MNGKLRKLRLSLASISVFRNILSDDVISELRELMDSAESGDTSQIIDHYGRFVHELYERNVNFSKYLLKLVTEDENIYIISQSQDSGISKAIAEAAENELLILQELSQLTPEDIADEIGYSGYLPKWETSDIDFIEKYHRYVGDVDKHGYGKWAKSDMFIFRDGSIVPVKSHDTQKLSELYGYDIQRNSIINNTLALINGKPALNALLYGDAGTGKSSTVKAIVNEYSPMGLRLIEITKEQLRYIPEIVDEISGNPLKFIIFIDDLSFTAGEDSFGALKATLEGSVAANADNMVIYATSNRRHLIKETFSDREGDDVHRNDTLQETLSLSARFGLRVNFSRPDKNSYVAIAYELAKSKGINISEKDIALKAEQFTISSGNGRSPRTAKQFVEQLLSE
ncbi:MAG: ATPase family associated with various cellular activities (AAA) [Firmicutes bacterium ADurb.BinA205]|nr:MAG: ATPase family associated with various cellular activities (AAA) [Firmicutes bacterium ADurb.BinA205]